MPCDNLIFLHVILTESLSRHDPACPIEYFVKIGLNLQVRFSKYFSIFLNRLCLGTFPSFEKNFSSFGNAIKQFLECFISVLLTTLVGISVVKEFFLLILNSSRNIALVRIFIKVFLTKIVNFAAADEKNRENNEQGKGRGREQTLIGPGRF